MTSVNVDLADEVLSREEAARFLRVSLAHLDKLPLARSYMGRRPIYLRSTLLRFVRDREVQA